MLTLRSSIGLYCVTGRFSDGVVVEVGAGRRAVVMASLEHQPKDATDRSRISMVTGSGGHVGGSRECACELFGAPPDHGAG